MGLLDALFSNNTSGSGGLLDFLRNNGMNQQMASAALPSDQAQYGLSQPQNAMAQMQPPIFAANQPSPLDGSQRPAVAPALPPSPDRMPQFGKAADYTPGPDAILQNAQPTQGQVPQSPQQLPAALGGQPTGFLDRLNNGLQSIGRDGSLIGALTGNQTDSRTIAAQNLNAQFQSVRDTLIQSGLPPQQATSRAMLAVMNPEAGKTILGEALTNKEKWGETGSDSFGNKTMGFINERDQTVNGKPVGQDSSGASSTGFLAPGVKQIDSLLQGQDYLKQFSPEVQASVKDYVDGKSMPTGNPRKGFTQTVKMIAQKYGADIGQPADDTTYAARRQMRTQLSSSSSGSLGGQINIGNTAAGHLADLSQRALDLGNWDTGIAPLTNGINMVRGLGTEQAAKMEALKGAAQHYGQEITKFYAGSAGGHAERDRFLATIDGAKSPKELAAVLSTEAELMQSRLTTLGDQIKGVLGEEGLKQYPVLRPDGQTALAKVEENVSRLKGGQGAGTPPSIQEGATATNPQTGAKITFRGGKWQ